MEVKAISYSYWRSIKRGTRTFESIPDSVKNDVRTLAYIDVQKDIITEEQYNNYIGESYTNVTTD